MDGAHLFILVGGAIGIGCILIGLVAARIGTPVLLVFMVLGMLAGEDGPGGIQFDDFRMTYLLGSLALVIILLEGGLKTTRPMLRSAGVAGALLATLGVAVTAGIVAVAVKWLSGASWTVAFLIGALVSPTDAAAVAAVLRARTTAVPERLIAVLEVESGFNDPMAVFLTLTLTEALVAPTGLSPLSGGVMFLWEMGGGAALGLAGGVVLAWLLARVKAEASLRPVLLLAGGFALFGAAQMLHASGFLAVYCAGIVVRARLGGAAEGTERAFEAFAWIAQIGLFVLLGLLVTPHHLPPFLAGAGLVALALMLVGRPVAAALCLRPLGYRWGEIGFAGWVGLRGAVPIYLAIVPVLSGVPEGGRIFAAVFVIVLLSLGVQGWTIAPAARLFGFRR